MLRKLVLLVLSLMLGACNMPSVNDIKAVSTQDKVSQVWINCVDGAGVLAHVCLHSQLNAFTEATEVTEGFTILPNTLVMVNEPQPFFTNGNQLAVEDIDYYLIAGAGSGLSSTYLTKSELTMRVSGKQLILGQTANPYIIFTGWPQWPPVLPTPLVIASPAPVDPTATPTIIPAPFTFHGDFLSLWAQLTPDNNITVLLDGAYEKWGKWYGGEFVSVTFTRIAPGTIVWSTTASNIVDLNKQQFNPYGGCLSAVSTDETVIIVKCDAYVVEPPFKYLVFGDAKTMETAMLPAPPYGVYP